jgi:hypothetical protein
MSDFWPKLGRKQEEAIAALLSYGTIEKAARAVGITPRTLHRWLQDAEFQAAYRQARHDAVSQSMARLQQGSSAATTVLLRVMLDESTPVSVRVRAADSVLNHAMKATELEAAEMNAVGAESAQELPTGLPMEFVAILRGFGADVIFGDRRVPAAPLAAMLPEPRCQEADRLQEFFEDRCQIATEGDVNSWKKGRYWVPVADLYPRYVAWAAATGDTQLCPKGSFENKLFGLGRKKARVRPAGCRESKQIWVWLGIRCNPTESAPV